MRVNRFDQTVSTEETNRFLQQIALTLLAGESQTPAIVEMTRLIGDLNLRAIVDWEPDYGVLERAEASCLRQVTAFFNKRKDIDAGYDRRERALASFREAESICRETNDLIKSVRAGRASFKRGVEPVIYSAQRKISRMLGRIPLLSQIRPRFGPGATTQVQKRTATAGVKLGQSYACSEELLPSVGYCLEELAGWIRFEEESDSVHVPVEIHDGRVAFVPKNAKTFRSVAVEPSLNSMFQCGIGDYLTGRFRRFGLDLTSQERNQSLAQHGSLTGVLATLDLSMASDTVATETVAMLLPLDWYLFLSRFRTGHISGVDGSERLTLSKFSSMGNGFTFQLESLIFFALSLAATELEGGDLSLVSVYGDDIIVPTCAVRRLSEALEALGFRLNDSKSFSSGPFRESCGKDYYRGIDIRPVYVKDRLSGADLFRIANAFNRAGNLTLSLAFVDAIAPPLRRWGPDGYGDGHLVGDWVPKPRGRHKGWGGYTFDTYVMRGRTLYADLPGDRVLPVYSIYASPPQRGLPGLDLEIPKGLERAYDRNVGYYNSTLTPSKYTNGKLGHPVPGTQGYKLVSIYVLG